MKIQIINNDPSGVYGYNIYNMDDGGPSGKLIHNENNSLLNRRYFDESEILELIGPNNYKEFESGRYEFNITKKQIFKVSNDNNYFTF
ncbi:MAG: hypothetical protein ABSA76_06250 [Bacteroidales bacterium]